MKIRRSDPAGGDIGSRPRPWLVAGLVNAGLLLAVAAWQSGDVISVVTPAVTPLHRLHFLLHIAMIAMLAAAVSGVLAELAVATGRPRWGTWAATVVQTLLWVLIVVDLKVFRLLGVHLDDEAVLEAIRSRGFFAELHVGAATCLSLAAFTIVVGAANVGLSGASRRWLRRSRFAGSGRALAAIAAGVMATGVPLWSWCTARALHREPAFLEVLPLFRSLYARSLGAAPAGLSYPDPSLVAAPALGQRRSVVLVVFESFRGDAVGAGLTPNLFALSRRDDCIAPRYAFAGSHETAGSLFSLMYGLDAYHLAAAAARRVPSWPLETLRRNGYRLLGGSAARMRGWSQSDVWISQFDEFDEFAGHGDYRDDEDLAAWADGRLASGSSDEPFLLLLFFHATHHNYYYPPDFEIDRPVLPPDYDHFMGDDRLAAFRTEVVNRYRNAVRYTDHLLARIEKATDRLASDGGAVLVVTGDHGEEFWDHGLLGHSAARLIDARTRVPLLICAQGLRAHPVAVAEHADVLPTLLDLLGSVPRAAPVLYSNGCSLLKGEHDAASPVVVSAAHRELGRREVAVVEGGCKYRLRETLMPGRFALRAVTGIDDEAATAESSCRRGDEVLARFDAALSRFVAIGARGGG